MNTKERFLSGLKATRVRGVKVRQNVRQCCRGCVTAEQLGTTQEALDAGQPYVWTYGGQYSATSWVERFSGELVLVRREALTKYRKRGFGKLPEPEEGVYFYHGNGGADVLAEEMSAAGFEVEWDGSEYQAVLVKMPVAVTL